MEPEQPPKVITVRGLGVYDRAFYENNYNKHSVEAFLAFAEETKRLIKTKGWPLEMKFNKRHCSFKYGPSNAFGILWISSKSFAFFIKLPKSVAEKIQPNGLKMDKYADQWKQAHYKIDPSKTKVKTFLPLFQKALESVTGKKE